MLALLDAGVIAGSAARTTRDSWRIFEFLAPLLRLRYSAGNLPNVVREKVCCVLFWADYRRRKQPIIAQVKGSHEQATLESAGLRRTPMGHGCSVRTLNLSGIRTEG